MKGKLSLEGRNPQAMPLSKVIKNLSSANIDVQAFALKDIVAEAKAAAAVKEAYEAGVLFGAKEAYKKGLQAGKVVSQKDLVEYNKSAGLLSSLLSGLSHFSETMLIEAEKDVLKIAVAVASRIVRKEISENPEILLAYVQEGLKSLGATETAVIRIHPKDLEMLSNKSQEILQAIQGVKNLQFEQDPSLLPGECIVETKERSVDGRVGSQLSVIERGLIQKLEGKGQ